MAEQTSNIAIKDFVQIEFCNIKATITKAKNQIVLWMFIFWATGLAAIFAMIKYVR
jgi:hypothetical protein